LSITNILPPPEGATVAFMPDGNGGFFFPVTFADDANPTQVGWQIIGEPITFINPPTNRNFNIPDADCPNTDGTVQYQLIIMAWYANAPPSNFPRSFFRGPNPGG